MPDQKVDAKEAKRFLDMLEPGGKFVFMCLSERTGVTQRAEVFSSVFDITAAKRLAGLNKAGLGVFVTINHCKGGTRREEDIDRIRAVFGDMDGVPLSNLDNVKTKPICVVESSPGKYHAYWRVDGLPVDQFRGVQRRIVAETGSDGVCIDPPRVLRVPGFFHQKGDNKPFLTHILEMGDPAVDTLSSDEVLELFPPISDEEANDWTHDGGDGDEGGGDDEGVKGEKPHDFDGYLALVGHGEGQGGMHRPLTRAIAYIVATWPPGEQIPIDTIKLKVRMQLDNTTVRKGYDKATLKKLHSDSYLNKAIKSAVRKYRNKAPKRPTTTHEYDYIEQKNGKPVDHSPHNCMSTLRNSPETYGMLAYNILTRTIMLMTRPPWEDGSAGAFVSRPWRDSDITYACAWFEHTVRMNVGSQLVQKCVQAVAEENKWSPIEHYLVELEWDGTERLSSMLHTYFAAEDDEYTREVSKRFMVGAVARAMDPGCKMDTMLVLEGKQGTFKSTAVEILFGREYFTSSIGSVREINSKEAYEILAGRWGVEHAELSSIRKNDVHKLKDFMSTCVDSYRPAYAINVESIPRQCVFVGTVNYDGHGYLQDSTGNRRFWPVACGIIDIDGLKASRDQLWAEAYQLYTEGEIWWLGKDVLVAAEDAQSRREIEDPWVEPVAKWVANPRKLDDESPEMDATMAVDISKGIKIVDVLLYALDVETPRQTKALQNRVGSILRGLGFSKRQLREYGGRAYFWTKDETR